MIPPVSLLWTKGSPAKADAETPMPTIEKTQPQRIATSCRPNLVQLREPSFSRKRSGALISLHWNSHDSGKQFISRAWLARNSGDICARRMPRVLTAPYPQGTFYIKGSYIDDSP